MAHEFQGKEGQVMPMMPDVFVAKVSERYIELYEKITGRRFVKSDTEGLEDRIYRNVLNAL